jgi:hypothetical protein
VALVGDASFCVYGQVHVAVAVAVAVHDFDLDHVYDCLIERH